MKHSDAPVVAQNATRSCAGMGSYKAPDNTDRTMGPGMASVCSVMYTMQNAERTKYGYCTRYASAHCHNSRVVPNTSLLPPTHFGAMPFARNSMEMRSHCELRAGTGVRGTGRQAGHNRHTLLQTRSLGTGRSATTATARARTCQWMELDGRRNTRPLHPGAPASKT